MARGARLRHDEEASSPARGVRRKSDRRAGTGLVLKRLSNRRAGSRSERKHLTPCPAPSPSFEVGRSRIFVHGAFVNGGSSVAARSGHGRIERIRTGIPFEVCDLSYSSLANRSRLPLPLAMLLIERLQTQNRLQSSGHKKKPAPLRGTSFSCDGARDQIRTGDPHVGKRIRTRGRSMSYASATGEERRQAARR
jgi:hypothetical protein